MIASLAPGEVVSYGDVAHDAGRPGAARAVGALLASTDVELPWWRVVRGDGRIVTGKPAARRRYCAPRVSSSATAASSPPPSGASPDARGGS